MIKNEEMVNNLCTNEIYIKSELEENQGSSKVAKVESVNCDGGNIWKIEQPAETNSGLEENYNSTQTASNVLEIECYIYSDNKEWLDTPAETHKTRNVLKGLKNVKPKRKTAILSKKSHKCRLCEYETVIKQNLTRHNLVHTGEKPFKCKLCKYQTGRKSHLTQHIRTHTGEKPYKCNICDNKFASDSLLRQHIPIHTGEKPYLCNICQYRCARKSNLAEHVRIHTGEKPFECDICGYKVAAKSGLLQHVELHKSRKLMECSTCGFKSFGKQHLTRHIRTHRGEKLSVKSRRNHTTTTKSWLHDSALMDYSLK